MCVVHVNNATSCYGWKTPGCLPACREVLQWRVWAVGVGEGRTGGGGGGGGGEARGVVSGDKARQMGQTMRHRHPPCMSTTAPSLLQTLTILLSLPMCQSLTFLLLCKFQFCSISHLKVDLKNGQKCPVTSMFSTRALCSHSPNKFNFLPPSVCLLTLVFFPLSFLIVPSSDKKKP